MFTNSFIVLQQIIVMFLLIAVGYYLYRKGTLTNDVTPHLSILLNKYVAPMCILRSFQRPFDKGLFQSILMVLLCAAVLFSVSVLLANALFRPEKAANAADRRVSAILTNSGFMALPLLDAMFGTEGVFLGAAQIAVFSIFLWTYSVRQLSGGREGGGLKAVFLNPAMLATIAGFILFCSPVKLPTVVYRAVDFLGDLNTPLAMLVLGCFLAQTDLRRCFTDKALWQVSSFRLLLVPAISIALLLFMPMSTMAKLSLLTGMAAPSAIASAMFAQIHHTDYLFSTRVIALSTILSAVTLPLSIAVLETLLRLVG